MTYESVSSSGRHRFRSRAIDSCPTSATVMGIIG